MGKLGFSYTANGNVNSALVKTVHVQGMQQARSAGYHGRRERATSSSPWNDVLPRLFFFFFLSPAFDPALC